MDTKKEDDLNYLCEQLESQLDDSSFTSAYREKRLLELKTELQKLKQAKILQINETKDLMLFLAKNKKVCLVHFYEPSFKRCLLLNEKLKTLALKHHNLVFVKSIASKVPYLCIKLNIKVLPCLIAFKDGIVYDKFIGFERFGNSDTLELEKIENELIQSKIIQVDNNLDQQHQSIIQGYFDQASKIDE